MANCCSVDIDINFNSPDDAQAFYQWVLRQKAIADEKDTCLVLGDSDFVVIDDDVEMPSDHDVLIVGWVKWAVQEDKFEAFVQMVVSTYDVACIKCNYEEFGCQLYGYYQYFPENGELCCFYVPSTYWDAWKEDTDDADDVDAAYEKFEQYIYNCPEDEYEMETIAVLK